MRIARGEYEWPGDQGEGAEESQSVEDVFVHPASAPCFCTLVSLNLSVAPLILMISNAIHQIEEYHPSGIF